MSDGPYGDEFEGLEMKIKNLKAELEVLRNKREIKPPRLITEVEALSIKKLIDYIELTLEALDAESEEVSSDISVVRGLLKYLETGR